MKLIRELKEKKVVENNYRFSGEYKIKKFVRTILFNKDKIIIIHSSDSRHYHKLPIGEIEKMSQLKKH